VPVLVFLLDRETRQRYAPSEVLSAAARPPH